MGKHPSKPYKICLEKWKGWVNKYFVLEGRVNDEQLLQQQDIQK